MPSNIEIIPCLCGRPVNVAALTRCPACGLDCNTIRAATDGDYEAAAEARYASASERNELARQRAERVQAAEQLEREAAELQRRLFVDQALARMTTSLHEGRTPYLHAIETIASEYSVDGRLGGHPADVQLIAEYGWDGWEIVATIPRTVGMSLRNAKTGKVSYGGGIGGLVAGAVVLLRLPVTTQLLEQRPEVAVRVLEQLYDRRDQAGTQQRVVVLPTGALPDDPVPPPPTRASSGTSFGVGMVIPFGD